MLETFTGAKIFEEQITSRPDMEQKPTSTLASGGLDPR